MCWGALLKKNQNCGEVRKKSEMMTLAKKFFLLLALVVGHFKRALPFGVSVGLTLLKRSLQARQIQVEFQAQ